MLSFNSFFSYTAFHTEGKNIEKQELQFIGKMLEKSAIDFGNYGIEKEHLLNGESDVTYKEMEFVMKLNPSTQVLSINLKQEITSSEHNYIVVDCLITCPSTIHVSHAQYELDMGNT